MPDYLGQVLRGYQAGQDIATNQLAGEAFNATGADRQSALGRLASVNPQAAMSMQDRFQSQDAAQQQQAQAQEVDHAKKINGAARFMLQAVQSKDPARIQGAWNSVAPYLSEVTGRQAPPQWDDSMLPGLYQTLAATGSGGENKPVILSNGAQLVDPATGQVVANNALEQKDPDEIRTLRLLQQNPDLLSVKERLAAAGRAPTGEGGKASDWVVQQGADGQLYRVNKLNGAAIPVVSQGTQQDGAPVIGANSFKAATQEQKVGKARAAVKSADFDLDRLAKAARDVLDSGGLGGITGVEGRFPNLPGSKAANAQALLDTLKSQVGFSVLQNMRANSPTGGALGAVSDRENEMLQSNLAALGQAQSEQQYRQQLQNIIDYAKQSKARRHDALEETYGSNQAQPQAQPQSGGVDDLLSKYGVQ